MRCHLRTSSMSGLQQGQPKGGGVGVTPSDLVEMHFARYDFHSMNNKTQKWFCICAGKSFINANFTSVGCSLIIFSRKHWKWHNGYSLQLSEFELRFQEFNKYFWGSVTAPQLTSCSTLNTLVLPGQWSTQQKLSSSPSLSSEWVEKPGVDWCLKLSLLFKKRSYEKYLE